MSSRIVFFIVLCVSVIMAEAMATVPGQINFQGTLADSNGNPITGTIYLIRFTIYADSTGGLALWSENQTNVVVTDGLFRVLLGSSTAFPISLFNGSRRWLSIRIQPDAEDITPRLPLVMVPYSYRSKETDHSIRADSATYAVQSESAMHAVQADSAAHAIWADSADWAPNALQVPLHLTGDTASAAIIWGTNTTENGFAIVGENGATHCYGYLGGNDYGAFGWNQNFNRGYLGHDDYGVYGEHSSGTTGFLGGAWGGAYGGSASNQYWGYLGFVSAGAYGYSTAGPWGLLGNDSIGVWGSSSVSSGGGVYGRNSATGNSGWLGTSTYGAQGQHSNGHVGYLGGPSIGAYGRNSNNNYGYLGGSAYAVYGNISSANGYGGYFYANVSGGTGIYARGGSGGRAATLRGNVVIQGLTSGTTVLELGEGLDYAEGFDVADQGNIAPGTVLIIDPDNPGKLAVSIQPYDSKVAGIVAGAKGLGSGVRLGSEQYDHNVALAGRVYCNVDAFDSNIEPGDLLTTSDLPGYAMKATDYLRAQGAILGKAMERLEKGQKGQILVLVTLQ